MIKVGFIDLKIINVSNCRTLLSHRHHGTLYNAVQTLNCCKLTQITVKLHYLGKFIGLSVLFV